MRGQGHGLRRRVCGAARRESTTIAAARDPGRFLESLGAMLRALPRGPLYAVEVRSRALVGPELGELLADVGAVPCLTVHPTMPDVETQSRALALDPSRPLVMRWMLRANHRYEEAKDLYAPFDRIVEPDDPSRDALARLARAATGRRRVLAFEGSFHGTTGVGAHMGDARFVDWAEPRSLEVTRAPRYALDAVARAIEGGDVAVVVAETLQASSGMHPPPRGFYAALSALCRAADVPLVLDEVQTGWGRTGKLWAFEHFDVEPDAVVLGKGMTGGLYPMAACVYDPRLAARLERDPFVQQSTGGGAQSAVLTQPS
jgi:hypothetical protein